jgi:hypothetical protein
LAASGAAQSQPLPITGIARAAPFGFGVIGLGGRKADVSIGE